MQKNWKRTFYTIWVGQAFSQLSSSILQFAIVWYLTTNIFSWMIPRFYHGSVLYGSLAALFLVIMWLRIILYAFFSGQVLNTVLYLHEYMYDNSMDEI